MSGTITITITSRRRRAFAGKATESCCPACGRLSGVRSADLRKHVAAPERTLCSEWGVRPRGDGKGYGRSSLFDPDRSPRPRR